MGKIYRAAVAAAAAATLLLVVLPGTASADVLSDPTQTGVAQGVPSVGAGSNSQDVAYDCTVVAPPSVLVAATGVEHCYLKGMTSGRNYGDQLVALRLPGNTATSAFVAFTDTEPLQLCVQGSWLPIVGGTWTFGPLTCFIPF